MELPIRCKSKNSFIAPNTRIITHESTPILCHGILKPKFQIAADYWISQPDRQKIQTPDILTNNFENRNFNFPKIIDLAESGLYTQEKLESAQQFMLFLITA